MTLSTFLARLSRLMLFVGALVMLPSPAQGQVDFPVANFLDCVTVNSSTNQTTAFFGYSNPTNTTQSNAAGSSTNFIVQGVPDQGQPSVFSPGTHHYVFAVTFPSASLRVWVLGASIALVGSSTPRCLSQTFTYQGRLTEGSTAASGTYEMQFKLFDAATGSNQIGTAVENSNVTVVGGVFTVPINVLSATAFSGSDRFLEIWVKRPADASFTLLSPRQPITATPYALHSQSAAVAETAINATMLNSKTMSAFVLTNDSRLNNERAPTAGSSNYIQDTTSPQAAHFNISGNGTVGGNLTVSGTLNAALPSGSGNYIQNAGTQQAGSNFNISGNGTAGGTLTGNAVNATTQYNIGGARVLTLGNPGQFNTFVGISAGQANPTGIGNSFFGASSGLMNTVGAVNSFFGLEAGMSNVNGADNAFFGAAAGKQNTASDNSFFGAEAGGFNTTGTDNAFVGRRAGFQNTTGTGNSFFGRNAGFHNTTGVANSFFGLDAGSSNDGGNFNSFYGREAGLKNVNGSNNAFFGAAAGRENIAADNSFFGVEAGRSNTTGSSNAFFGRLAGYGNTTGSSNSFFGMEAGKANTTAGTNSFFGSGAGLNTSTGNGNSFFGAGAGQSNIAGVSNSFFGTNAGRDTLAGNNAFFGSAAGRGTSTGSDNAFIGYEAGINNTTGSSNTFIGRATGGSNTSENNNTFVGFNATGAAGITNATAIGAFAHVTRSNAVVIGSIFADNGAPAGIDVGIGTTNPQAKLHVAGNVRIDGTLSKSSGSFQIDHPLDPANKYLYHSFVESPDMMNIYNGNVVLDRRGEAVITLPEWFQALNREFRYQLTCIGGFAQVYVAVEVRSNRFTIAGGKPGMKVSWQVTGVRHDAYAEANRIPVEENKPADERGTFLHPELFLRRSASASKAKRSARQ